MGNSLIKLYAKLSNRRLVWLKDYDGEVTLSIAYPNPFGDLRAKRYWPFNIRTVTLLPNGKVGNGSYVVEWKYYG